MEAAESPRRKAIVSVTRSSGTSRSRGIDLRPDGVSSADGNSAFTVIFLGCNSLARTSRYAFNADFAVTYAARPEGLVSVADELMAMMTERRFRHLPVITDGALVGIVSIGDVVKHHVAEVTMEATAMREYITHS